MKTANFDLLTSAKHSLNILKDDIFDPVNKATNPSTSTIVVSLVEIISCRHHVIQFHSFSEHVHCTVFLKTLM